jgi:fucose permease
LGPKESAAKRIAIMGLINKVAGVVVPIVFSALVLSNVTDVSEFAVVVISEEEIQQLSERLIMPYIGMAAIFLLLIVLVYFSKLPKISEQLEQSSNDDVRECIFQFPQVVLRPLAIFSYLGVEVISGDRINLYGSMLYMDNFSVLTAYTMSTMVVGYIIGVSTIPRFVSQSQALIISALVGLFCNVGIVFSSIDENYISEILWLWAGLAIIPNLVFFCRDDRTFECYGLAFYLAARA